jgi:prepilin-type N-terminal cleavage/methylation domain-containing protein
MRNYLNKNGFTLIELSIVLVIIGMLIGLGSNMIGPLTIFVKSRETRDIMDANVQSIISWTSSNKTIPTSTSLPTIAKSPVDAWGRPMLYRYAIDLTKDSVCGRSSTKFKIFAAYTSSNVAFAILSRADNNDFKSTFSGFDSNGSCPANITCTITTGGTNADLIRWVTLDELKSKIDCIGSQLKWGVGSALKIVNNELPYGNYSSPYSATIFADGGVDSGSYQWRIVKNTFPNDNYPNGITATASPFINSTSALKFSNISTTNWSTPSTSLNIQGYPRPTGSYYFSVFVKDALGITSKPFVLTVNPAK